MFALLKKRFTKSTIASFMAALLTFSLLLSFAVKPVSASPLGPPPTQNVSPNFSDVIVEGKIKTNRQGWADLPNSKLGAAIDGALQAGTAAALLAQPYGISSKNPVVIDDYLIVSGQILAATSTFYGALAVVGDSYLQGNVTVSDPKPNDGVDVFLKAPALKVDSITSRDGTSAVSFEGSLSNNSTLEVVDYNASAVTQAKINELAAKHTTNGVLDQIAFYEELGTLMVKKNVGSAVVVDDPEGIRAKKITFNMNQGLDVPAIIPNVLGGLWFKTNGSSTFGSSVHVPNDSILFAGQIRTQNEGNNTNVPLQVWSPINATKGVFTDDKIQSGLGIATPVIENHLGTSITIADELNVNGKANINGNVNVQGGLSASGSIYADGIGSIYEEMSSGGYVGGWVDFADKDPSKVSWHSATYELPCTSYKAVPLSCWYDDYNSDWDNVNMRTRDAQNGSCHFNFDHKDDVKLNFRSVCFDPNPYDEEPKSTGIPAIIFSDFSSLFNWTANLGTINWDLTTNFDVSFDQSSFLDNAGLVEDPFKGGKLLTEPGTSAVQIPSEDPLY